MVNDPEQLEPPSNWTALSADVARQLLERAVREDCRLPALDAGWWKACAKSSKGAVLDETVLRELVQALLVELLGIPLRSAAAVDDVAVAVAHSIHEDPAALEKVQSWWSNACGRAA